MKTNKEGVKEDNVMFRNIEFLALHIVLPLSFSSVASQLVPFVSLWYGICLIIMGFLSFIYGTFCGIFLIYFLFQNQETLQKVDKLNPKVKSRVIK